MNILPKKRWHVRTKENIARVHEDEAKYTEEQRQKQHRALLAEQESRTDLLRKRASSSSVSSPCNKTLLSDRNVELVQGNKEYEAEKHSEQESKEKSIGLLTYLGQSVIESNGQTPWYNTHPKQKVETEQKTLKLKDEWERKKKVRADPLTVMNQVSEWFEKRRTEKAVEETRQLQRACSCIASMPNLFPNDISVPKTSIPNKLPLMNSIEKTNMGHGHKRRKRSETDSETEAATLSSKNIPSSSRGCLTTDEVSSNAVIMARKLDMDRLRTERLQREHRERERAALVMAQAMGLTEALDNPQEQEISTDERDLPFNSAFNPELSASLAERRQRQREFRRRPDHHD